MHRTVVIVFTFLLSIMMAALRMRCSTSWQFYCRRAPSSIDSTAMPYARALCAASKNKPAPLCQSKYQLPFSAVIPKARPAAFLSSSKHFRMVPFASNSNMEPALTPPKSFFQKVTQVITAAVRSLVAVLLLVAAFPYLLSTKWGTITASKIASRICPGDVHIQRISVGWTQPVSVEGVSVHEGNAADSRQLFCLDRMSSAEPLHQVCRGSGLTLTLTKPVLDCSLDNSGEMTRIARYIEAAKLMNLITGASRSKHQQQQQSTAAAAGSDLKGSSSSGITSHPILVTAASLDAEESDSAPAVETTAAAAAAAAAAAMSPMRQRLTQADAVAHLSAEFRLPQIAVYMPDGQLLLPQEIRAAVGSHIHAVVAAGTEQVNDLADELDEDSSWLQQQQQHESASEEDAAAAAAPWSVPPVGVGSSTWAKALPVMLQVSGDHVNGLVRGWRLGPERYLLQQPAQADWEFTPELARLTLSQANPLLEEVISVKEGGHVFSTYSPTDGFLPAMTAEVTVSPMKLQMGQGQLLKQIYRLLNISQNVGFIRRSWLSDEPRRIEVWTGPLHVSVQGPGLYKTKRTDMIIGSGSSALHVAIWGSVDTNRDTLDMQIGLPASTLAKAGIKHLPDDYVLPISVTGHMTSPEIEWQSAARKLAVLSAMQLGRHAWQQQLLKEQDPPAAAAAATAVQQGIAGMFGAANKALTNAASSFIGQVDQRLQQELQEVPEAAELPWEEHSSSSSSSSSRVKQQSDSGEPAEATEAAQQQQQQQH